MTATTTTEPREKSYVRFSPSDRMEHFALVVTFTMLGVTGLSQRYSDYQIAKDLINLIGGIESVRIMHRFFATLLMLTAIYHGGVVSYKLYVRRVRWTMIPSIGDMRDALGVFLYNIGLRKTHPKMPRYNFGEKAEYLAVVWGTILMVITGFILWNPVAATKLLPGQIVPAAHLAHSAEAVLAFASIILWHMYNVHIKRFNRAMFTGKISYEAMHEEHGAELEAIERGVQHPPVDAQVWATRRKRFFIYATFMTLLLVSGLVFFVTFEDTALQTISRRPITHVGKIDASQGDADQGEVLWNEQTCQECHGTQGEGVPPIPAIQATELDVQAFAEAIRRGPADMPAFNTAQVSDTDIAHLYAWLTANR